jgi:hypothetical protein
MFSPGQLSPSFRAAAQINRPRKEKESLVNMKTRTPHISNSMKHSSRDCRPVAGLLIPLLLACFALLPGAQATDLDSVLPNGNTADGSGVLVSLTSGVWNSGFGFQVLNHDTAGKDNTATGVRALFSDTTGSNNTATGVYALYSNTTGWYNSAVGANALANNTQGNSNTANGYGALYYNTEGHDNAANGFGALYRNTTGIENMANGSQALYSNTTGSENTADGAFALYRNTTGHDNAANGQAALVNNTTGHDNTAVGVTALDNNTTGNNNIAVGSTAGFNLTTGDNNIDIGNNGVAGESNTIRIGDAGVQDATYIAGISGATVAGGVPVIIDASGHLGTIVSSARFKDEIKPMDKASEAILALKPVTFCYKQELDPERIPQFGLVAEEVEKVNPNLVARDAKGEVYTVRYEAVNAMLLNEFLKERRKVEELEAIVDRQQKSFQSKLAEQDKQIEALASVVEKVSAQLEMSKRAPQVVVNKP